MYTTQIAETIFAYGHKNILATHKTTFEVKKEAQLTKKGNCVIAVSASKAISDLSLEFKENLRRENTQIKISVEAEGVVELINAFGTSQLILMHPTDIVVRKSSYICHRTLAIKADKAACDLSRKLVEKLKQPKQKIKITFTLNLTDPYV